MSVNRRCKGGERCLCDDCKLAIVSRILERLMGQDFTEGDGNYRVTSVFEQVKEALMDRKRLREELADQQKSSNEAIAKLQTQVEQVSVDRDKLSLEVKELQRQVEEASLDRERLNEEVQNYQDRILHLPHFDMKNSTYEITRLGSRVDSLTELINILRKNFPGDILVFSGREKGPAMPAHIAILKAKSTILRDKVTMNSLDGCKAPSTPRILTIRELDCEQLKIFLDFLYSDGILFDGKERLGKHATIMLAFAHEYEVSSLKELCEHELVSALEVENVLEYLEISDEYSCRELKNAAMALIKRNKEVVVGSSEFDGFAMMNPRLSLEIVRRSFLDA